MLHYFMITWMDDGDGEMPIVVVFWYGMIGWLFYFLFFYFHFSFMSSAFIPIVS